MFPWVLTIVLVTLGGCASVVAPPAAPPSAPPAAQIGQRPPTPPVSEANQRAASPAELLVERQWLQSWFEGTPVTIMLRGSHSLIIDVPREHCFSASSTRIRPALAVVLDKVAQSMRRLAHSNMTMIAAPEDRSGKRSYAVQRATRIQRHLRSVGVPAAKLGKPSVTSAAAVQLRIDVGEP